MQTSMHAAVREDRDTAGACRRARCRVKSQNENLSRSRIPEPEPAVFRRFRALTMIDYDSMNTKRGRRYYSAEKFEMLHKRKGIKETEHAYFERFRVATMIDANILDHLVNMIGFHSSMLNNGNLERTEKN